MFELFIVKKRRQGYGLARYARDPGAVYAAFREEADLADRERFTVLLLDGRHRVLGFHTVSVGSLTTALVHPREAFKAAILANAAAIILVHNHPSGDPEPSAEDHALTARLREAGELLGVPVLDHVIVGDGAYTSLAMRECW